MIFEKDLAFHGTSTKFLVPSQAINDESDYSGIVGGGNGNWVKGDALVGHKAILVAVTGAGANITGLTFGLAEGTDANGGSAAFMTGKSKEVTASIVSNVHKLEVTFAGINPAKYYCPAAAAKGNGAATLQVAVVALFPDPPNV
jgi:hypothetical protein